MVLTLELCLAKIQSVVGKVHVHGEFSSIIDTRFRVRDTSCWSVSAHKTPILVGTELDFVANVAGTTPHGRIGGANRPVEGKK